MGGGKNDMKKFFRLLAVLNRYFEFWKEPQPKGEHTASTQ
jgi:hypothetical protein